MTERKGVEIDYCPQCRGVWLDRGELDKIIERSSRELLEEHRSQNPGGYSDYKDYKKRKRKSFLGEFFDFD
jgi:hypothetical protein